MSSIFGRAAVRIVIGIAVIGIVLTILGVIDLFRDIGGSHASFNDMSISDFRQGDIVQGVISENFGCAAQMQSTVTRFGIQTGTRISGKYYVIPFYDSFESGVPSKIILYYTGNSTEITALDRLVDETDDYNAGSATPV